MFTLVVVEQLKEVKIFRKTVPLEKGSVKVAVRIEKQKIISKIFEGGKAAPRLQYSFSERRTGPIYFVTPKKSRQRKRGGYTIFGGRPFPGALKR
jgi:hypothetical protein